MREHSASASFAQVVGHLAREARGRLRVQALDVTVHLGDATEPLTRLAHCLKEFEDYCIVTQSVRQGIQVNVRVEDATSRVLFDRAHDVDSGQPSGVMLQLEHDPSFPD